MPPISIRYYDQILKLGLLMNCTFCGSETEEITKKDNIIVIAHSWCVDDRKQELNTRDIVKCLLYEDRLRYG